MDRLDRWPSFWIIRTWFLSDIDTTASTESAETLLLLSRTLPPSFINRFFSWKFARCIMVLSQHCWPVPRHSGGESTWRPQRLVCNREKCGLVFLRNLFRNLRREGKRSPEYENYSRVSHNQKRALVLNTFDWKDREKKKPLHWIR